MAEYQKIVFEEIEFSARPTDLRGYVGFLKHFPFYSGKRVGFWIQARPKTEESKKYRLKLSWEVVLASGGPTLDSGENAAPIAMDKAKTWRTDTIWFGEVMRHALKITLNVYKPDKTVSQTTGYLVAFDILSSDTQVMFWITVVSSFGAAVVGAIAGTIIGGLIVTTLTTARLPSIPPTQAAPTPYPTETAPASQLERGNTAK